MNDSLKRLLEYLVAGLILWLIIEEIKKYRENRKLRKLIEQGATLTQVSPTNVSSAFNVENSEQANNERVIVY